jgi:mannitol/fructose-specific phosphotransferase system IIA component
MTQAEFIALAAARYEQLQALNQLDSFYDYEKQFDQLWTGLGQQVLEKNLGELPNDPQKKTPSAPDTVR